MKNNNWFSIKNLENFLTEDEIEKNKEIIKYIYENPHCPFLTHFGRYIFCRSNMTSEEINSQGWTSKKTIFAKIDYDTFQKRCADACISCPNYQLKVYKRFIDPY